jgi:hypothetical protein
MKSGFGSHFVKPTFARQISLIPLRDKIYFFSTLKKRLGVLLTLSLFFLFFFHFTKV